MRHPDSRGVGGEVRRIGGVRGYGNPIFHFTLARRLRPHSGRIKKRRKGPHCRRPSPIINVFDQETVLRRRKAANPPNTPSNKNPLAGSGTAETI